MDGHVTEVSLLRARWIVVTIALGLVTACSAGTAGESDDRPGQLVVTPTADPAHSVSVTWRSPGDAHDQRVTLAAPDGTSRTVRARSKGTPHAKYSGTTMPAWTAGIDRLKPNTTYTLRVRGVDAVDVRTAASGLAKPWSFLALGDTQVDNAGVPASIIRRAVTEQPDARLMLHAGDVVDDPTEGQQWDELFAALAPARGLPFLASIGNHEQCRLVYCKAGGAEAFTDAFTFPDNGARDQRPIWYRTDYQGVRFIVLDTFGRDIAAQARFLEQSLAHNPMRWTVVLMHQAPFDSREDRSSTTVFYDLWPIMKRHDVDLVLTGHDHSYDRGYEGDRDGPVVVTANSGPKNYVPSDVDWKRRGATRVRWAKNIATYQVVDVSRDRLRMRAVIGHVGERAIPADAKVGEVLDQVTITRGRHGNTVRW